MALIPDYGDPRDPSVRARYARLEGYVGIAGNLGLAAVKLVVGFLINSVSIIADGFHTLSDVGTSIVIIVGMTAAKKEPDEEHPFGHGRYEYVASLILAILLIMVGMEILVSSIERFLSPEKIFIYGSEVVVYSILVGSIIVKEAMARYGFHIGHHINSVAVEADAWHHRSDAITTVGVILAIAAYEMGYPWADPIVGGIISIVILYPAARILLKSISLIVGTGGDREKAERIKKMAEGVDGVLGAHDVYVHDYGNRKIASIHVEVPADVTTDTAHDIATGVERVVERENPGFEVIVHVEPVETECDRGVERALVSILRQEPEIVSYHSLRKIGGENGRYFMVHAIVKDDMSLEEAHALVHRIKERLKENYPGFDVEIHVEPAETEKEDSESRSDERR